MLLAGVIGGIVNIAISGEKSDHQEWLTAIVAGVGASLLMPLFLQTVSSDLLVKMLRETPDNAEVNAETNAEVNVETNAEVNILVFGAFCLLASISSKAFIQTLSNRVLREAQEAKKLAEQTKNESRQTARVAEAARDVASYGIQEKPEGGQTDEGRFPTIQPGEVDNDPWAGQFGGSPISGSRELSAEIELVPGRPDWCTVMLMVRSIDQKDPLTGPVQFYLHPTFMHYKPIVKTHNGVATITVFSEGAFVVGALTDDGKYLLELNLAEHPMAREPWRSR
jgi:hypothetical protein